MATLRGGRRLYHLGVAILAGQGGQRLLSRTGRPVWRQPGRLGFASSAASAVRHTSPTERWQVRKEYTRIRQVEAIPEGDAVRELTRQIQSWAKEYEAVVTEEFFHRKSHRVVLAVLHVEFEGRSVYVRGINGEVSLPTGSVCAERVAIHKARTDMPGIMQKDMKGIAVIEVPGNFGDNVTRTTTLNPLQPCGVCQEYLQKIQMESPGSYVLTFPDLTFGDVYERLLFWSVQEETMQPEALGPWACRFCGHMNVPLSSRCTGCKIDRFSFEYTRAPIQQRYFDVLAALADCEVPMGRKALRKRLEKAGRMPDPDEFERTMARLVRPPLDYTSLVSENEQGLYSITYEGRQLVAKRAASKLGKANGVAVPARGGGGGDCAGAAAAARA